MDLFSQPRECMHFRTQVVCKKTAEETNPPIKDEIPNNMSSVLLLSLLVAGGSATPGGCEYSPFLNRFVRRTCYMRGSRKFCQRGSSFDSVFCS